MVHQLNEPLLGAALNTSAPLVPAQRKECTLLALVLCKRDLAVTLVRLDCLDKVRLSWKRGVINNGSALSVQEFI